MGIKAVLGRITYLRKKNYSINCATNNWMMVIGNGKAKEHKMMTEKIIELDQLLLPSNQMTKNEAAKFMKKRKNNNEGWITIGKNIKVIFQSGLTKHVYHYKCITMK